MAGLVSPRLRVPGVVRLRTGTHTHSAARTRRRLTPARVLLPAGDWRSALQQQVRRHVRLHFTGSAHVLVQVPLQKRAGARCGGVTTRAMVRSRCGQPRRLCLVLMLWLGFSAGRRRAGQRDGRFRRSRRHTARGRVQLPGPGACETNRPAFSAGGSWIAAAPGALQQRHGAHPHDPGQGSGPDRTRWQNVRVPFTAPGFTSLTLVGRRSCTPLEAGAQPLQYKDAELFRKQVRAVAPLLPA